jgi:methanogenic corrinoid protein MtbC1
MSSPLPLHLSIGALSRATGVPVNTLRTWERRYGVPSADRTDGGHRLYPPDTVEHLRLVVQALDAGHRPGQVLSVPPESLRSLLVTAPVAARPEGPIDAWISATRALDGAALVRGFTEEAARLGLPAFLESRALPFLRRVGEEWSEGELRVFHEHFASARLDDFIAGWWRPLADTATGEPVVCATLPGDLHNLGLQMAAGLLAVAGYRVVFLGPDTPVEEIAAAADQVSARVVVVAVGTATPEPRRRVVELRAALPDPVRLLVGGPEAPPDVDGAQHVATLPALIPSLADD